jgi:predicted permease
VHTLLQDVRYAFRQLRSHPGFALTAILSLALGIGATVSVFSVIYAVLVNPYPYTDPSSMAHLVMEDKQGREIYAGLTGPQLRQFAQARSVQSVAAWDYWNLTVTGRDVPENVASLLMIGDSFPTFGVAPQLGRNLGPSDSPNGQEAQPVVELSHRFWLRHYNGDPSVIGQTLELEHKKYTIVGVTQPRFTWGDADVYLPQKYTSDPVHLFYTTFRLRPGSTRAMANAELQPLLEQFSKETPTHFPPSFKVNVKGLNEHFIHDLGGTLFLLFAAVALLLAIGCGNVSILLLARGTAREHEFAVRSAVGASSFRIVRQLLTESVILALTGAGLGVLLAYRALGLIVAWLPQDSFPHEAAIHINLPVLLFSVGLAVLTGILFGLFPALQLAKPEINQVMQSNGRKVAGSVRGKHLHTGLIAGQIALTLLLLTAASAAMEGFLHLMRVPLGYDPHNVMTIGIPVHENAYKTFAERINYFEQLRQKVAAMPDVISTGISSNATPPSNGFMRAFELLGKPSSEDQQVAINLIDPGYFTTLRIPLLQGRVWDATEIAHSAPLALVNQTFARRYYPNGDILGHSVRVSTLKSEPPFRLAAPGSDGWIQVVGVVGDALNDGLDKPIKPAIFVPYSLYLFMGTQILVRGRTDPLALLHSIQQQVASVDHDQQVNSLDLEAIIKQEPEWARGRLISVLFAAFSVLALALAAVGLYSVASYSVVQRTNEFGIRMALGAQRGDVLKIVLASAGVSVGIGIGIGLALSIGLNRLIARWVENSDHNPLLVVGASLLLLAVAALACLLPARRASSVDPMTALRCE